MEQNPYNGFQNNVPVFPTQDTNEKLVRDPNFKKDFIEPINEEVLQGIFSEILKKTKQEEKLRHFIPFERVETTFDETSRLAGVYHPEEHTITLNEVRFFDLEPKTKATAILEMLIHEEIHALSVSTVTHDDWEERYAIGLDFVTIDKVTKKVKESVWTLFNEGLTELIKDDILAEYIKRTGDRTKFELTGYEQGGKSFNLGYPEGRLLSNRIFDSVAKETGLPLDIIREAFVTAYFSADAMDSIAADLKETINIDLRSYFKKMTEADLQSDIAGIMGLEEMKVLKDGVLTKALTNYLKRNLTGQ